MQHPPRELPGPGQESVWDYPRPPALRTGSQHVRIVTASGRVLADTTAALQLLETSHPPSYYIPPRDVDLSMLAPSGAPATSCEFKGRASYFDLVEGARVERAVGWSYPSPTAAFQPIADHLTFYADRVGLCTVDGVAVVAQPGAFYGGWITPWVAGPFKGPPGTMWW
jgi:uncharacterized protein (DUF427 family)